MGRVGRGPLPGERSPSEPLDTTASVGDCIDAENNVVDCDSSSATKELVTDQSEPDAIACVAIGDNPQVEVTVDDGQFCAEER